MYMCIQMVLTVFVITLAFRAESEYQIIIVFLGSATHSTSVLGSPDFLVNLYIAGMLPEFFVHFPLISVHTNIISCSEEEHNEIKHG